MNPQILNFDILSIYVFLQLNISVLKKVEAAMH